MDIQQMFMGFAEDNPGAAVFIAKLAANWRESPLQSGIIIGTIVRLDWLRGELLHKLYAHLCDQDPNKVFSLLMYCPSVMLKEACIKGGKAGKEIVKDYLSLAN